MAIFSSPPLAHIRDAPAGPSLPKPYPQHAPTTFRNDELDLCDFLLGPDNFPRSLWIMSLQANVLYHLHGEQLTVFLSNATN
jgi:hypothetical protein